MKIFRQAKTSVFIDRKQALALKRKIQKGGWINQEGGVDLKLEAAQYTVGLWHPDLIPIAEKIIGVCNWKIKED